MATKKVKQRPLTKKTTGAKPVRKVTKPAGASPADNAPAAPNPPKSPAPTLRLSALNSAALVLAESTEPMTCQELIAAMAQKGLWTSPTGKTPAATLYSSILKEIRKGPQSRFKKTARGQFARM